MRQSINRPISLKTTGFDEELRATAQVDDMLYHVDGAIVGEEVTAIEVNSGRQNVYCSIHSVVKPSKARVTPLCKYFSKCGNCQLQYMDYDMQLSLKTQMTQETLRDYLGEVNIDKCKGLYYPYKFRNKLHLAFGHKGDKVTMGFFVEDSKNIVDIDDCILHDMWANNLIKILRTFVGKFKLQSYSAVTGNGTLRYAVARCIDNKLMLTIVAGRTKVLGLSWLYKELSKSFGQVSLYLNINTSTFSNVFGEGFTLVGGSGTLSGSLCGVEYQLLPKSFIQTNSKIASAIYNDVVEIVKATKCGKVIDLYSGIGITSVLFAKAGLNVSSIEIEQQSVTQARQIAKLNKLDIDIKCGDANILLPQLASDGKSTTIFVDPPRAGLQEATATIIDVNAQNIVYLSCGLASLASDLKEFCRAGYRVTKAKCYDMFPHTPWVETLVCLSRK